MNARKLAEALRLAAEAIEEDEPPPSSKPEREPRPITDVDRARARRSLRRLGVDV